MIIRYLIWKRPVIKRMHTTRQVYMSKPAVEYINPLTQKLEILKENKNKSGIYRWINKETGKSYVGSSTNLSLTHNAVNWANVKILMKYNLGNHDISLTVNDSISVGEISVQFRYINFYGDPFKMLVIK